MELASGRTLITCLCALMLRTVQFIWLSCRLRRDHYRWGNMLAMDQGVVEEWLSEFKVRVCSIQGNFRVSEWVPSVSAIKLCVADPSWQCHIQLCGLIKRQSCSSSRTLQGHQGELQWCMNTYFYICIYVDYCQLCCILHMTLWYMIGSRKISKSLWLASSFSRNKQRRYCTDGCIVHVFGCLFPSVAGTSLPPAIWVLQERWTTPSALCTTVPAWAPVEPSVCQRSQRPPHIWMHRGPAAGHLQPGREYEWRNMCVCVHVRHQKNVIYP